MGFRLFKPSEHVQTGALALSSLSLLLWAFGCGSRFVAASGAGGSSMANGGSAGDSTSSAGESGSPDSAGNSSGGASAGSGGASAGAPNPDGGAGGKPTTSCDCAPGYYCQDGTFKCLSCGTFLRFQFAAPEKLSSLMQSGTSTERFPRAAASGSALFYTVGEAGQERLWYAASPVSGVGVPVSEAGKFESGPLLAPGFDAQDLFFDRLDSMTGKRSILMVKSAGGTSSGASAVLAPINAPGFDDYSIAIAPDVGRAYWMSTRNGKPELLWYTKNATVPTPPAALDLKLKAGANTCPRLGSDATPWVNTAGTLLLFRSESVNDNCQVNDGGATDLFAVPLAKDGTPFGNAIALSTLNTTGGKSNESDPSLSRDSCAVYFASDSGTGNYDLYRALRN